MARVTDLIHLDVPADPRSLAVLRTATAAAGVSLREDLTIDVLDDLRLAVDELAAVVIHGAPPGTRLDVSISTDDDVLTIVGHRTVTAPEGPTSLTDVSTLLLDSVCRQYQVTPRGTFAAEFDLAR